MSLPLYPTVRGLAWPVKRTLEWDTLVQKVSSGKELRLSYYTFPINHWELTYGYLKDNPADTNNSYYPVTDLSEIEGFYNQQQGRFSMFWWNDVTDNSITAQNIAVGDGFTTAFQLLRTKGGFTEPVQAPQTWTIYLNGVAQSTGFTVSSTGVLTFTAAPGAGVVVSWTGTYYWNVRFDDDSMEFDQVMYQLWENKQVKLVQVKL